MDGGAAIVDYVFAGTRYDSSYIFYLHLLHSKGRTPLSRAINIPIPRTDKAT